MMIWTYRYGVLSLLILGLCSPAVAQDPSSRERQAMRRAQQQAQKATSDLAAAQEKLSVIEAEKSKVTNELDGLQESLKLESSRARKLQQLLQSQKAESDEFKQRSSELRTASEQRIIDLGAKVAQLEKEVAAAKDKGVQLEAIRVGLTQRVATCEESNVKLHKVGRSIIEECRDRSASDTFLRLEPFTGIAQVNIENRLEEQRDLIDTQKIVLPSN